MLSEHEIAAFRQDGYVLGHKILNEEQVGVLQQEVERVIRDRENKSLPQPVGIANHAVPGSAPLWQIVNIWEASEPFRQLISNSIIAEEVAQLTEANELRIWHDQIQYKAVAGGKSLHWHQDSPYWPILKPLDKMLSAWIALDEVNEENGCMSMVRGSHKWGERIQWIHTNMQQFDKVPAQCEGHEIQVVTRPVPKGHVHYHHSLTWHGSPANNSGRPRRAIALHYLTDEIRFHSANTHCMKPFIHVADGEVIKGDKFPLVWQRQPQTVA